MSNTTILKSVLARLEAERVVKVTELTALDAEIAGVKAMLGTVSAPTPVLAAPAAVPVASAPAVGARVPVADLARQSGVEKRTPVRDVAFEALSARIEATDFHAEVPSMPAFSVVQGAALKRTQVTNDATVVTPSRGMLTICKAFLRGETPTYLKLLRELQRFSAVQRSMLLEVLNNTAGRHIEKAYPWLAPEGEMPLTPAEMEDISRECLAYSEELARTKAQRAAAVHSAAHVEGGTALARGFEALADSLHLLPPAA